MGSRISVDDLRLVEAVARHGSLGAAARELLVSQPSASQRLGALERRLGTRLFDRDTTGARATAAGREVAQQATHVLAHLAALPERALAAARERTLAVGTIPSLAAVVFAALDLELDGVTVQPEVEHGPTLLQRLEEGALDAAVVTIADQTVLPRGVAVTDLGSSPLVTLLPDGAPGRGRGRRPYAGQTVVYCTVDRAGDALHRRLADLGAAPRPGATVEAAVRMGRARRCAVVVPELATRWYGAPGDRTEASPAAGTMRLSLVTRTPVPAELREAEPRLRERLRDPAA
ncbi:LysR family transcriptional regulator [Puerhibacterium puerhi]|uniref:LysR family transcriptional regulator n=1 Tax=Puerhibacterium puerhi TaxID=2692623 RepID=UPI00135CC2F6|nr:LysR family transcriptional regulator [Puerhibacterium puerhi]